MTKFLRLFFEARNPSPDSSGILFCFVTLSAVEGLFTKQKRYSEQQVPGSSTHNLKHTTNKL
jgi:hypothetical protein